MTLEQLLREIRQRRLILTFSRRGLVLWAPNTHVPLSIRSAIRSHSQQLQALILAGDYRVCENAMLHKMYWYYAGAGAYRCEVCEQLQEVS